MITKYSPQQSQSPKPNILLPSIPTPSWQPKEPSNEASPLNDLKCLVSAVNPASVLLEPTPVNKLTQIFNQILSQMPPLGMSTSPATTTVQLLPPQVPSQPPENSELDCPLDLSTVPCKSNCYQPRTTQNLSPQTGSATNVNEIRSDNFCRRNRTSISSTQPQLSANVRILVVRLASVEGLCKYGSKISGQKKRSWPERLLSGVRPRRINHDQIPSFFWKEMSASSAM